MGHVSGKRIVSVKYNEVGEKKIRIVDDIKGGCYKIT